MGLDVLHAAEPRQNFPKPSPNPVPERGGGACAGAAHAGGPDMGTPGRDEPAGCGGVRIRRGTDPSVLVRERCYTKRWFAEPLQVCRRSGSWAAATVRHMPGAAAGRMVAPSRTNCWLAPPWQFQMIIAVPLP